MKHLLIAVSLVFGASAIFAQDIKDDNTDPIGGPVMTFENTIVEYGEIEQGSEPVRMVSFTNTGTEPLIISNARGSCGCTVPTWPKEPIMPGETSEIKVRYDTKRIGPINKSITITTNDKAGKHVLRVQGKVLKKEGEENLPKKESIFNKSDGQ